MWTPIGVFFIVWNCSFAPDETARLKLSEVIEAREKILIEKIVKEKEDQIIRDTIRLRNDI